MIQRRLSEILKKKKNILKGLTNKKQLIEKIEDLEHFIADEENGHERKKRNNVKDI